MDITYSAHKNKCDEKILVRINDFVEDIVAQYAGVFDLENNIDKRLIEKSLELAEERRCLEFLIREVSYQSPSLGLVLSNILIAKKAFNVDDISTIAFLEKNMRSLDEISTKIIGERVRGQKFPAVGAGYSDKVFILARKGKRTVFVEVERSHVKVIREKLTGLRGAIFTILVDSPYIRIFEISPEDVLKEWLVFIDIVLNSLVRRIFEELSLISDEEQLCTAKVASKEVKFDIGELIKQVIKVQPYFLSYGSRLEMFVRDLITLNSIMNFLINYKYVQRYI